MAMSQVVFNRGEKFPQSSEGAFTLIVESVNVDIFVLDWVLLSLLFGYICGYI